jgi:deaminated glutathione amidase
MRVALAQITSVPDPAANLRLIADSVALAADAGAELVVFPEASMACFGVCLAPLAEPLHGRWATAVAEIAARHGVVVVAGMFTPAPDGRVYNTLLVTGGGKHWGYDKIHLYDAFGFAESRTVAHGDRPQVFEHGDLSFGVATCYDVRFPEMFRQLAENGAVAVLLSASWGSGPGKQEQWELLVRARALDCGSWVLACGQADPQASGLPAHPEAPTGIGHSLIADPYGRVHARLGAAPELLIADIDPSLVDTVRRENPVAANRRL